MKSASAPPSPTSSNTIIGKLSKGYRQRVGLAQAIIHNPPVLILDEPTSGLDPEQQREARQLIASLSGDHTIILSTHILSEVEQSCSKVIIINAGEIVAVGFGGQSAQPRGTPTNSCHVEVAGAPANAGQTASGTGGRRGQRRVSRQPRRLSPLSKSTASKIIPCVPNLARAIVQSGWNLTELRTGRRIARRDLPRTDQIRSKPAAAKRNRKQKVVTQ